MVLSYKWLLKSFLGNVTLAGFGCWLGLTSISLPAQARTNVYIQNNTTLTLQVSTGRDGRARLHPTLYSGDATVVGPGERRRIMWFERAGGVTDGTDYYLTQTISAGAGLAPILLKQRMRGTALHSLLWQTINDDPWYRDRNTHTGLWRLRYATRDKEIGIKYRAYLTEWDDDIEYIFQEDLPIMPGGNNVLNVLAWNVYMRPTGVFWNGQSERADLIPAKVRGYDVLVFSETFDGDSRAHFRRALLTEYPHMTRILSRRDVVQDDGGVIILSKWPIEDQDQQVFSRSSLLTRLRYCAGSDCAAEKGVVYAKINKNGKMYHVFGTHTQADGEYRDIRTRQFQMIREFVRRQGIPAEEPVIIAGDMNVNRLSRGDEYREMLRTLNAIQPPRTGHPYSYHRSVNDMADGDGGADYDYVLYSRDHVAPTSSFNEVRVLRPDDEWQGHRLQGSRWDLSDHFPVYGYFNFPLRLDGRIEAPIESIDDGLPDGKLDPQKDTPRKPGKPEKPVGKPDKAKEPEEVMKPAEDSNSGEEDFHYTAVLQYPVPKRQKVKAGSLIWDCYKDRCTIDGPWPTPGVSACRALVQQVGTILSYGYPGKGLGPKQMTECNRAVGGVKK